MYRKIMGFLEAWKESEHRKPLILQGARQVGKTYSIWSSGAPTMKMWHTSTLKPIQS